MKTLRAGIGAGIAATLIMDAASTACSAALGRPRADPAHLGRWIGHMPAGRFTHDDIRSAAPVPGETLIGLAGHYAIGATLGTGYQLLPHRHGSLPLALTYGAATTGFAWLAMFPAWGFGIGGRAGPQGQWALSLMNHLVYGLSLGLLMRSRARQW